MYQIGDKIVYPLYGAGTIEEIEKKEIDGENLFYYVLIIPIGNLKIKLSAVKAESLLVRPVHSVKNLTSFLTDSICIKVTMPNNWNLRYKENMERIKTGDTTQVALVFYSLLMRERERGLSTAEKKMMTNTKQILLSEIMLSMNLNRIEAENSLNNIFK